MYSCSPPGRPDVALEATLCVQDEDHRASPIDYANQVHPLFNDQDADISLRSSDDTTFHVRSIVLQLSSGWFRALLSLPQGTPHSSSAPQQHDALCMAESGSVVAGMLSVASGQALPALDSIDYIEDLLHAAEKYDMPGLISIIRVAITSLPVLEAYPVRVIGIASRWGWTAEARLASRKTVGLDLLAPDTRRDLAVVESPYSTGLMLLHRKRCELLRAALDSPQRFFANARPGRCVHCQREVEHAAWARLKYAWLQKSDTVRADVTSGTILRDSPQLYDVLNATCPFCNWRLYDTEYTIKSLCGILDGLPTDIEL